MHRLQILQAGKEQLMYEGLGDYADFPKAEVLVNVYADFDIKCVLGGTETVGKKKKN